MVIDSPSEAYVSPVHAKSKPESTLGNFAITRDLNTSRSLHQSQDGGMKRILAKSDHTSSGQLNNKAKSIGTTERVSQQLNPGMMKGPNAPFMSIDILHSEVKPKEWNNIPVPLVEAVEKIIDCCLEIKKTTH